MAMTTNRGVGSWGEVLGDDTVAAAMLDHLLHRSVVLNLDSDSYRLRDQNTRAENSAGRPPEPDSRYSKDRSPVGNSAEHNCGNSMSLNMSAVDVHRHGPGVVIVLRIGDEYRVPHNHAAEWTAGGCEQLGECLAAVRFSGDFHVFHARRR